MIRDELLVASPTGPGGRIESLDILRGFALLGMLIVHFHDRTVETSGFDDVVRTLVWRLVESKSHGTFALLFGAGFAIQLRRATGRGRPFVAMYLRRLAALAVFGFAAHALFGFNVLLGYAVWGVPLLLLRNWPTRALLVTAALSTVSVFTFESARDWYLQWTGGPAALVAAAEVVQAGAHEFSVAAVRCDLLSVWPGSGDDSLDGGLHVRDRSVRGSDCVEHSVARAVPIRPRGVAVALDYV